MNATLTPKHFGIFSQTGRMKAEVKLAVASESRRNSIEDEAERMAYVRVYQVIGAIDWAYKTGRLHISAEKMLQSLSGHQFAKLVCRLAAADGIKTDQDVCDYIRGDISSSGDLTVRGALARGLPV